MAIQNYSLIVISSLKNSKRNFKIFDSVLFSPRHFLLHTFHEIYIIFINERDKRKIVSNFNNIIRSFIREKKKIKNNNVIKKSDICLIDGSNKRLEIYDLYFFMASLLEKNSK